MKRPSLMTSGNTKLPFQVAISCWVDLLGYGRMISASEFNPLHFEAREAIKRIRSFHRIVSEHSTKNFPTLVMNDGAVAYRDLSLTSTTPTRDFLVRAWKMFEAIRKEDMKNGHPGPRMVLACGFRILGRRAGLDASREHFKTVIDRLQSGKIDAQRAVNEAASMRPRFDIVPQLQANFAFTKAYAAEQTGTKGKLPGPEFYVDKMIFGNQAPGWIDLGPDIDWQHPSLSLETVFSKVLEIRDVEHPKDSTNDILNGLSIAQRLTKDPDILARLRNARKPSAA